MSNQNLVWSDIVRSSFWNYNELWVHVHVCVKMFYIFLRILEKESCCMNLRNFQKVVYLRRMSELKVHWGKAAHLVNVSLNITVVKIYYWSSSWHASVKQLFSCGEWLETLYSINEPTKGFSVIIVGIPFKGFMLKFRYWNLLQPNLHDLYIWTT